MNKTIQKIRREKRTRGKLQGTTNMPRMSVFRSNTHFYAQIIDDTLHKTVVGVSDKQLKEQKRPKTEIAKLLGKHMAEKAKEHKITRVIFDRGSYMYHGRIKAFAEGAREGGLQF